MPQLFLFGDSLTWGSWDTSGGGWAQRLRAEIDKYQAGNADFWCPLYNLGIPGDTAQGVAKRIGNEMDARLELNEEPITLIAIGINDSATFSPGYSFSPAEYRTNLQAAISNASVRCKKIGIIGILPIVEKFLMPVSWEKARSYTWKRAEEFNLECMMIAAQASIPSLNLWKMLEGQDFARMLFDGLHPNPQGHAWLHGAIREFLRSSELLREPFR